MHFGGITQNSMILFVAPMEATINLIPNIIFMFFMFKTSYNLTDINLCLTIPSQNSKLW